MCQIFHRVYNGMMASNVAQNSKKERKYLHANVTNSTFMFICWFVLFERVEGEVSVLLLFALFLR